MEGLHLNFYRVLNKTQPLYSPIFLRDLILTIPLLDYPMAPSPLRGAPSRREPRETAGGASPSPTDEKPNLNRRGGYHPPAVRRSAPTPRVTLSDGR